MQRFVTASAFASYPPSNLNHDDDRAARRPALMGDAQRLRISQSQKRAWRTLNS